jgi:ribosomal protein S18 acetylase RimI-like enzyme
MTTSTIEIRLARYSDAEAVATVHDEAWLATYRGIIPGKELDRMVSKRGAQWWETAIAKGNRISLLYFGEDLAGYANYGRNRAKALDFGGEIYELYLLPQYTGLGFGRRLFRAARRDLLQHGLDSMVVWALSENDQAMGFYEALGGRKVARSTEKFGDKVLDKTAFGWKEA